jgi:hypothetical protein|tara:strand:- start:373 stop:654 length:282 start_codon:yes stop_codon:yes gene_type:complete
MEEDIGYLKGQMETIKGLITAHVEESRTDRALLREELKGIKNDVSETKRQLGSQVTKLEAEVTKYKHFFRAIILTVLFIATFRFGDVMSLWVD